MILIHVPKLDLEFNWSNTKWVVSMLDRRNCVRILRSIYFIYCLVIRVKFTRLRTRFFGGLCRLKSNYKKEKKIGVLNANIKKVNINEKHLQLTSVWKNKNKAKNDMLIKLLKTETKEDYGLK